MNPLNDEDACAPVVVLGLGNLLMADDGVGLEILRRLHDDFDSDPRVEFVDGGTQGLMLTRYLAGRRSALLLDAVRLGHAPGAVHVLDAPQLIAAPHAITVHEGGAGELLSAAALTGDCPAKVVLVGIEPAVVRTGIGLSESVLLALPEALTVARKMLLELVQHLETDSMPCTK